MRRASLVAVLLYVTLDLSLPAMPGAFVFEPDGSVESVHVARARGVADVGAAPLAVGDWSAVPAVARDVPPASPAVARLTPSSRRTVSHFPRAALATTPPALVSPAEDPH